MGRYCAIAVVFLVTCSVAGMATQQRKDSRSKMLEDDDHPVVRVRVEQERARPIRLVEPLPRYMGAPGQERMALEDDHRTAVVHVERVAPESTPVPMPQEPKPE